MQRRLGNASLVEIGPSSRQALSSLGHEVWLSVAIVTDDQELARDAIGHVSIAHPMGRMVVCATDLLTGTQALLEREQPRSFSFVHLGSLTANDVEAEQALVAAASQLVAPGGVMVLEGWPPEAPEVDVNAVVLAAAAQFGQEAQITEATYMSRGERFAQFTRQG